MSKKQLREHKRENQLRKADIIKRQDARGKRSGVYFLGGVVQDGKYSGK